MRTPQALYNMANFHNFRFEYRVEGWKQSLGRRGHLVSSAGTELAISLPCASQAQMIRSKTHRWRMPGSTVCRYAVSLLLLRYHRVLSRQTDDAGEPAYSPAARTGVICRRHRFNRYYLQLFTEICLSVPGNTSAWSSSTRDAYS